MDRRPAPRVRARPRPSSPASCTGRVVGRGARRTAPACMSSPVPSTFRRAEAVRHRPRPGRDRPRMTRGDLADLTRWRRRARPALVDGCGRAAPEAEAGTVPASTGSPPPGCGWSRSTAGRSASSRTTGSATTPSTRCWLPTPRRSASTTRSASRRGSAAGSAYACSGRGCCAPGTVPGRATYFAAPDHRNAASLRILAKAGFTEGLWFDEPLPDGSVDTVVGCTLDVARVLG